MFAEKVLLRIFLNRLYKKEIDPPPPQIVYDAFEPNISHKSFSYSGRHF